ncbi:MAG: crossover junction endodeoxyribonuclease RuvC [Desulfomonile sp.]|nr:crossover junction endodeoxyribonuclease RuvC [Desulfomonile sp.]
MVIIGIDPGSNVTGYGIIRKNGARAAHVASGRVRAPVGASQSKRLWLIYSKLSEIVSRYRPSAMVVESLFHAKNSQSLIKLSQIRGAILLLGENFGMEIHEYAPMEIKKGLTGYGRAEKEQVMFMVGKILGLSALESLDEADALAMALYHAHVSGFSGAHP